MCLEYNFPFLLYLATWHIYTQVLIGVICDTFKNFEKKTSCTWFYYYLFKFFFRPYIQYRHVSTKPFVIFGWLFIKFLYFLAYIYVRDSFLLVCTFYTPLYMSYMKTLLYSVLCNIPIWQVIGLILLKRARDNI